MKRDLRPIWYKKWNPPKKESDEKLQLGYMDPDFIHFGYFHQWVIIENIIWALIEKEDGQIDIMDKGNVCFKRPGE
jgi:hypothetical protein